MENALSLSNTNAALSSAPTKPSSKSFPLSDFPLKINYPYRAFKIKDEGMLAIRQGAYVIAKRLENLDDIQDGDTYIIRSGRTSSIYRRLFRNNKKEDTYILSPDSHGYIPLELKTKEMSEVWEFVCQLNLNDYKPEDLNKESIIGMLRSLRVPTSTRAQ